MKRTLHPRPYSRLDNHVERAAEGFNQGCVILLWAAFFTVLLMYGSPTKAHKPTASVERQAEFSGLSETQYLLAVMQGASEGRKTKLSEAQLQAMDKAAIAATPENCRKRIKCDPITAAGF